MFAGRGNAPSVEAHPATPIELLPDAARGVTIDCTKLSQTAVSRVTGPTIQSSEARDYTLYVTRRWTGPSGVAPATWNPRSVTLDLLYGAGATMKQELALGPIPWRGIAYHACVQSLRAIINVQPVATPNVPTQDDVVAWICRGRPWTTRSEEEFLTVNGSNAAYDVPAFARRLTLQPQVVSGATVTNARVTFLDPGGTTVGLYDVPFAAGVYAPQTLIVPSRATTMVTTATAAGGVSEILGQWEIDA